MTRTVHIVGLGPPGLVRCPTDNLAVFRSSPVTGHHLSSQSVEALAALGVTLVDGADVVLVDGHPRQHQDLLDAHADDILVLHPAPAHEFGAEAFFGVEGVVRLVDRLLGPGGCPWDQEQTHESLKPHLVEETYEVLEAIDSGDPARLLEELGDLLLQPVLHAQIAAKNGGFDTRDVSEHLIEKLVRRHPHVFGDVSASDADEVLRNWDRIKQAEHAGPSRSILAGVPKSLPALLRALQVSKRAARVGFEWPDLESVLAKVQEEEAELREAIALGDTDHVRAELGDLLFTVVNVARWCDVDPEDALRAMLDRFTARFQHMEAATTAPLSSLDPVEWDALWEASKNAVG